MQRIITGDILAFARHYKGPRFHAVLCDPPYHLTSIVKRFSAPNAAPAQYGRDGAFSRVSTGFMGQTWDGGDVAFRPDTWAAIASLLYPGAHLLAFGGTRTYHRLACAIEDAGFEIRDMVAWLYGSGFPKSLDVSKAIDKAAGAERVDAIKGGHLGISTGGGDAPNEASLRFPTPHAIDRGALGTPVFAPATDAARQWDGWGTALKPAHEPIVIARLPVEGTVAANCLRYGTGALNIDGCRVMIAAGDPNERPGVTEITKPSASIFGNAMQRRGTLGTGRWPANVAHDGSEEVLAGFPQTTTGKQSAGKARPRMSSWHSKDGRKTVNSIESAANAPDNYGDSGSAARFFYCAKASRAERDAGCEGLEAEAMHPIEDAAISTQSNRRCVKCGMVKFGQPHCECDDPEWVETAGSKSRNPHPTVKPIALTKWLATLILPPPLDEPRRILIPFAGVMSEVLGALLAGWDEIVAVEMDRQYCAIGRARLRWWSARMQETDSSDPGAILRTCGKRSKKKQDLLERSHVGSLFERSEEE